MAVTPNPGQNPQNVQGFQAPMVDPADVERIERSATTWKSLLKTKLEILSVDQKQKQFLEEINKLGAQEARNATRYAGSVKVTAQLQKNLADYKERKDKDGIKRTQAALAYEQQRQEKLAKTAGGALRQQEVAAARQKANLQAERDLIKSINKERGLGGKVMDLFRTKEQKQRQIDIARARVGGGANLPPGGKGPGGAGTAGAGGAGDDDTVETLAGSGKAGFAAALAVKAAKALIAPLKAVAGVAKDALTAPFADAAGLLTGEDVGIGGGKLKTGGASSILGGLEKVASSIPLIGGLLGGLVGIFKTLVEAVLGVEQGMFRAARALNTSVGSVQRMTANFRAMAASSGNLAVNETRLLESEIEIGNQLGINKQLSGDILTNNVLLKEVVGIEAESRQKIAETSLITGRNAVKLTQSIIGTVGSFNKLTGTSFTFKAIMQEASKLSGVLGLTFAKYPEKIANTIMKTKALGFEMQQLDGIGSSLLDFESSISKEMEAQVLTGKEMNLTAAREAALNNDYAKLTEEIAKNVGNSEQFLKLNRIQQEAIAESVGMSANSLADVLKKQELYGSLQATDLKSFHEKIALLEKQGKTQQQISDLIGKDAYNEYTRLSTAEKISEVMEKIKMTFIAFVKSSGLFDFITKPERVNAFIKSAVGMLAGAVETIGDIIAGILDGIASLPFTDTQKWKGMASAVRSGTGTVSGGIRASVSSLGGSSAPSVTETVQSGAKQEQKEKQTSTASTKQPIIINSHNETTVKTEDYAVGKASSRGQQLVFVDIA
jgi:hypothetical protein